MAFIRPGQATQNPVTPHVAPRAPQFETVGNTALAPATSSTPVEFDSYDGQHISITFDEVRRYICEKATDAECKIFLETCRAYKLNPFTREAYLIHYDNKRDDSPATIVLGKNCYLKMAERHPAYDGFEAGVIVYSDGQIINREGSILYDGEVLLGGWAKVYRKDRTRPGYDEVKFDEYNTGKSLWATKPATMIRKVALVHALRETFPSTFGQLYDESEVNVVAEGMAREIDPPGQIPRRTNKSSKPTKPAVEITQEPAFAAEKPDEASAENGSTDDPFSKGEPL